jgi:hypothetical protein
LIPPKPQIKPPERALGARRTGNRQDDFTHRIH